LPVLLSSVIFFLLVYKTDIKNRYLKSFITTVSLVSFDMYLVSFILDGVFYKVIMDRYFETQEQFFPYLLVMVPLVFFTSFIIASLRIKLWTIIFSKKSR
jgi:hypothetical protein